MSRGRLVRGALMPRFVRDFGAPPGTFVHPKKCCLCNKPATRRVMAAGYCSTHMKDAQAAQRARSK